MIIGIDPGVTGAVSFLSRNDLKLIEVFDMPVMQNGKRQQINPYELQRLMALRLKDAWPESEIYLERVSAMRGQGVTSMFNFGISFGIIQGVIAGLGLPVTMVTPQSWKRRAKLIGKNKDEGRTLAQRLYPLAELGRKKDIGRADAILIARFGS